MYKYLITLALLLVSTVALGENWADLSWQPPTESLTGEKNAQGQCNTIPIPTTGPDAIAGFRIVYNTSVAALNIPPPDTDCGITKKPDPSGIVINVTDPTARSYRIQPLTPGTYYFMVAAINQSGAISFFTGPVSKTIVVAPTTFSTTAPDVFNVVKRANGFVLVRVGTVPLNTPCDRTQNVNGYNAVPVSAVTWSGTVRPIVVVATCSEH